MLVLARKLHEVIHIGDGVTVTVVKIAGSTVRLGVEAPRDVSVVRGEIATEVPGDRFEIDVALPTAAEAALQLTTDD